MDAYRQKAARVARQYFRVTTELTRLGWGVSGSVFLSPDLQTAVKVHYHREGFERELEIYRKLRKIKLKHLHGLSIPTLRSSRSNKMLIRMDVVNAPFLLDFAGAQLTPPDFSEDTLSEWRNGIREKFGANEWLVHLVYDSLSKLGIYYTDFRPSNLNLTGHPDFQDPDRARGTGNDGFE